VILSAEFELAAWDVHGRKSWSVFVEPPWSYEVSVRMVELDVMGMKTRFPLDAGPAQPPPVTKYTSNNIFSASHA
jgi:hypothetical protein